MSYPLTQAQRRFQKIKRKEQHAHIEDAKEELRDQFSKRRQAIEETMAEQLLLRGLEINEKVIRNLATQQAVQERKEEMSIKRWERKYGT